MANRFKILKKNNLALKEKYNKLNFIYSKKEFIISNMLFAFHLFCLSGTAYLCFTSYNIYQCIINILFFGFMGCLFALLLAIAIFWKTTVNKFGITIRNFTLQNLFTQNKYH